MTTHIKAQHTPGPWQTIWREDGDGFVKPVHNAVYVARINGEKKDSGANAALIVAAPDMLEALELMTAHYDDISKSNPGWMGKLCLQDYGLWNKALLAMSAAIAKAKGVKQ